MTGGAAGMITEIPQLWSTMTPPAILRVMAASLTIARNKDSNRDYGGIQYHPVLTVDHDLV